AAAAAPAAKPAAAVAPAPAPATVVEPQPAVVEPQPAVEEVPVQAVEPVVTSAPADEGVTHVVQDGEDITGLAIRYSLSPAEIRDLNNLGENDEIKPGQVLKLPAETQL
ncbi:MAG: LysM peptidoglycan-binding domain-containing protein, partial [Kiritimatiellae bacterium]|nr:LysM peptidoglycan-binding domain-containing protein [Kiritimatiellia bacterium]